MSKPGIGVVHVIEGAPGGPGGPGPEGPRGPRGAAILSGSGAPTSQVGVDGDFWMDTVSQPRRLYGPRIAGVWPAQYQPILTDLTPGMQDAANRASSAEANATAKAVAALQAAADAASSKITANAAAQAAQVYRDKAVTNAALTASDRAQTTYDRLQTDKLRDLANQSATIARSMLGEVSAIRSVVATEAFDWSFDSDPDVSNDWSVS